ncbi:NAD(P)-binding protein [Xylariaceae sp. AK1471]|nr:NAD(P)-binding protein [Xylariaceae sp. AK1471]
MASLTLSENDIPDLTGKIAVITGGASGIGFEAMKLMLSKGAVVHIIDRNEPSDECSVNSWPELLEVFTAIGPFHMVFANAGVTETVEYFTDTFDAEGKLELPNSSLLDVNLWGVLYTVKIAWSLMRRHKIHGSIVITASATSYAPEAALPVYSAGKAALVGLVRSLRHNTVIDNITINAVAPAGTITPLISEHVEPLTAIYRRRVEAYGKDREADIWRTERWNGRVIYVLGDTYTELEEGISDLRPFWFGQENHRLVRFQQAATDVRQGIEETRL